MTFLIIGSSIGRAVAEQWRRNGDMPEINDSGEQPVFYNVRTVPLSPDPNNPILPAWNEALAGINAAHTTFTATEEVSDNLAHALDESDGNNSNSSSWEDMGEEEVVGGSGDGGNEEEAD